MGKVLLQQHLNFFTSRMNEHNLVVRWQPVIDEHEYIFKIRRTLSGTESDLFVHLTDAYSYGLADFLTRPSQLRKGSFVIIGMPHASVAFEVIEQAREHRIGVGYIGKFMGALNFRSIWEYTTAEERKWREDEKSRTESKE